MGYRRSDYSAVPTTKMADKEGLWTGPLPRPRKCHASKLSLLLDLPNEVQDMVFRTLFDDQIARSTGHLRELDYSRGDWASSTALLTTSALLCLRLTCREYHQRFYRIAYHGLCLKANARPKCHDFTKDQYFEYFSHRKSPVHPISDCTLPDTQNPEFTSKGPVFCDRKCDVHFSLSDYEQQMYKYELIEHLRKTAEKETKERNRLARHDFDFLQSVRIDLLQRLWLDGTVSDTFSDGFQSAMQKMDYGKHLKVFFLVLSGEHVTKEPAVIQTARVRASVRRARLAAQQATTMPTTTGGGATQVPAAQVPGAAPLSLQTPPAPRNRNPMSLAARLHMFHTRRRGPLNMWRHGIPIPSNMRSTVEFWSKIKTPNAIYINTMNSYRTRDAHSIALRIAEQKRLQAAYNNGVVIEMLTKLGYAPSGEETSPQEVWQKLCCEADENIVAEESFLRKTIEL
ncbi:hypothetical protein BDZ85DRAFT_34067 [Elsinoe ampelina]|uniref:Uncharacterized protein n=1 Tax=Elsinoe ampelina TaxID=302913 RepID=A0A6A6G3K6_9PEZI|nr:hypothetical protein BDZ85DRAFT_34067 [Elsinoe ampelina]